MSAEDNLPPGLDPELAQFWPLFVEEAKEYLFSLEEIFSQLPSEDEDLLREAFRAAHSLKGGAATFGLEKTASAAHVMESLLAQVRDKKIVLDKALVRLLFSALDTLKQAIMEGEEKFSQDLETLKSSFESALMPEGRKKEKEEPEPEAYGFFDASADGPPPKIEQEKPPQEEKEGWGLFFPREDQPHEAKTPKKPNQKTADTAADTIRVHVRKVDDLVDLAGELVVVKGALMEAAKTLDRRRHPRLLSALDLFSQHLAALQDTALSMRMLPLAVLFSRFHRVVRELGEDLGKEVALVLSGEDTELDRWVIERLVDPLTHLVRNAIDHGLEAPGDREKKGKPRQGTLALFAFQKGGSVIIEMEDDGKGLDKDAILAKAREKRLVRPEETLADQDIWQLIFLPGFSTAKEVSEVSGRGVGMDVVKSQVAALGGKIEIETQKEVGTTFRLILPFTLAIMEGILVRVRKESYIVPLASVVEAVVLERGKVRKIAGANALLKIRDSHLPMVDLARHLDPAAGVSSFDGGVALVVETQQKRFALAVDDILAQDEVVVKSLSANFKKVFGFSAATILGDGRVCLILDLDAWAGDAALAHEPLKEESHG